MSLTSSTFRFLGTETTFNPRKLVGRGTPALTWIKARMCPPTTGRDLRYHEAATLSSKPMARGQQVGDPGPRWKE